MTRILNKLLFLTFFALNDSKMLRNDALISKMVSNFQKDNIIHTAHKDKGDKQNQHQEQKDQNQEHKIQPRFPNVVEVMQKVLCTNFPSIPCNLILTDEALTELIEQSIQQIKHKKTFVEQTTTIPGHHPTKFPIASEDLSSFLQLNDGYYSSVDKTVSKKHKKHQKQDKQEKKVEPKIIRSKKTKRTYGRKKLRQFFPQKMKFKDKTGLGNEDDNSGDRLSTSIEMADAAKLPYSMDPVDGPVWKVDYTRQGTPNFLFDYDRNRLQEKMVKNPQPVLLEEIENDLKVRKDVMHPDLFIKKNFVRQNDVGMTSALMSD